MKKILILIISIALLSGCSPNENKDTIENTEPDKSNEIEQIEEVDTTIKKEFIIENESKEVVIKRVVNYRDIRHYSYITLNKVEFNGKKLGL